MSINMGDRFKLISTGQRLEVSEIVTMYKLSPVGAKALSTPAMTEEELIENYKPIIEEETNKMAERNYGYNQNKDYTGFVCELTWTLEKTMEKLKELSITPPDGWVPHPEGFVVKEDHRNDMLIQFYNIETDEELEETFWIKFEDAISYWA
ncbi:hypothetical protein G7L40_20640 [Paenibacillus polymyxa]|uniref:Uncharacterized protein n=1 Tax=Paenibacillus polymyxa TaxID=1406 RepID=A0A378Y034_PAEPO|nr:MULTISPECIES: hypothetical protein [Paenibacillus]KZE65018.1 hypothetical protein AV545_03610 [Paenibacillus jamilae]MBE7896100.1 hypothetical protein [Paenibacillus polymyxa]MBG9765954.1 hypothetical protein [Paenibacillus polymyxa]MCC3256633.1 hypothetical protein [Paenibacillus polymyxa]QPK54878.1 hypothetical protein G7035_20685 [Paenibacillus polymyxa]